MSHTAHTTDRIERRLDIDADAERVWKLISEPGWWINDGVIVDHQIERSGDGGTDGAGEIAVVHDPVHGEFRIRTEKLEAPRYAAFRWIMRDLVTDAASETAGRSSTLVEFWIDERPGGGVTVRVAESGFAALGLSEEQRRRHITENSDGWTIELAAARAHLAQD